ncbi:hypothetical protein HYZ97_01025 [Candidatus Pacearchaeota archaeon]|nr:hypothetical protein [Candidatus Pacearchaeota archaeon]
MLDGGNLPKYVEELGIPQKFQPGPAAFERAAVIKADIEKAMQQLDGRTALAVKLLLVDNAHPAQIAGLLHCKLSHVFTLTSKGVQQMSDYLEGVPYRRFRRRLK